jgi:single-strand DNA-binding protein
MALNKAMVIGHLGQKPELRYIPTSGAAVTAFSVATNDVFLDKQGQKQERVDWHNIVVFGKLAETCAKYLDKGREIYVEGRLRTRAWEPSDGGSKQYRTEIVAFSVQFLGARPADTLPSDVEPPSGMIDEDIIPF